MRTLAWLSLARHHKHLSAAADQKLIASRVTTLSQKLASDWKQSAYGITLQKGDYVWGSSAVVLNQAMVLLHGYRLTHRPSVADRIAALVPGFLVGGPQPGQQDKKDCSVPYPSSLPAKSWLDHACSYASNEIAINWNAPLVYVSAALQAQLN